MIRILVLGGYGGFGGRVSHRLAAAGHHVLVAGRDEARAQAFCRDDGRLTPIRADRKTIQSILDAHKPEILVDASGPFQAMDYSVPQACIAANVHYIDIADSRAFVCRIGTLDVLAKAAGIVVISGASSVPALSGAVVRHLADGFERIDSIEITISASNRATAGRAVAAAILSQTGKPFELWAGKRWVTAFGWQNITRVQFEIAGQRPIANRIVGLTDVPDVALLPSRCSGSPFVAFRAGTELGFQNLALWAASWLVRWRFVESLTPFSRLLRPLQALTAKLGSDRSAMMVRVFGRHGSARQERRWTLIANDGDGPEIPSLAIVPLVAKILAGAELAGARDAGECLSLDDFHPAFDRLAVAHETTTRDLPDTLYQRVMGERFARLPAAVRQMHDVLCDGGAFGRATVAGAVNPVAALVARILGFPRQGTYPVHVHFTEHDGIECWTREFGKHRFHSELSQRGDRVVERFGPLRFAFDLESNVEGLTMVMRRWWIGRMPMPLWLAPRSCAREWAEDGVFQFDVPIALPLLGMLVHYRGWLRPSG